MVEVLRHFDVETLPEAFVPNRAELADGGPTSVDVVIATSPANLLNRTSRLLEHR